MSTELEVSINKIDKVFFEKTIIIVLNFFIREKGKLYLSTKGAFHTFLSNY